MNLFKTIYYIFVALIVMIACLLIFSAFPIPGNFKVMTVLSGSMEPALHTGSIVVVKPAEHYDIGDIITFGPAAKTKTPTTHRIHDIQVIEGKASYITKGDANNTPDAKEVLERDILGKVLFSVPFVGYAVDAAQKPIGFMLIIVVPAVFIIFDELKKVKDEIVKLRNKKKDKHQDEAIEKNKEKDTEQDGEIEKLKKEIEELKDEDDES